jgi:hypothetical protein
MIEFMHNRGFMTHMPFLAPLSSGGRIIFFCCSDETRIWKLVYEENNDYFRIETGLSEDTIECSPTAWQDVDGWHVSFIGGFTPECRDYFLYRMDGKELCRMSPARVVRMASTGFIFKDRTVYGDQNKIIIQEARETISIDVPDSYLYRISYCPDDPDRLLASVHNRKTKEVYLLEHDLKTGVQSKIECDGVPAYKCAILGNEIVYANKTGNHFEQRQLTLAKEINRQYLRTVEIKHEQGPI